MTDEATAESDGRRPSPRVAHDEAVARAMRENLRKRKAKQRALQQHHAERSTDPA